MSTSNNSKIFNISHVEVSLGIEPGFAPSCVLPINYSPVSLIACNLKDLITLGT